MRKEARALDSTNNTPRNLINARSQEEGLAEQPQPQQAGQQAQQEMVFLGSLLAFLTRTKPWPRQQVEEVLAGVEVYATGDGKVIFVYNGRKTYPLDPKLISRDESAFYVLEGAFRHLFQDEDRARTASAMVYALLNRVLLRNSARKATAGEEEEEKVSREDLIYTLENMLLEEFTVNGKRTIRTFYTMQRQKIYQMGLYCWQEEGGFYIQCEPLVRQRLREIAEELGTTHYKKVTRDVINEVIDRVMSKTMEELRAHPLKIAFQNAVVDFAKLEEFARTGDLNVLEEAVLEPDPDIVTFFYIPHRFREDMWKKIVDLLKDAGRDPLKISLEELAKRFCPGSLVVFKAWSPYQWETLFEIVGFMMSPRYFPAKIVVLAGSGSNGKTSFLLLLTRILGEENVVQVPLHELIRDKFAPADLIHKLANIYDDLDPRPLQDAGTLKRLTGEDFVCSDRKYRDRICFINTAKHIFTANRLPVEVENTFAFWRRILLVEFPNRFEENPTFLDRMFPTPEIEGLIPVSLVAYMRVLKRGDFSSNAAGLWRWQVELRQSSARAFLKSILSGELCVDLGYVLDTDLSEEATSFEELYTLYAQFCEAFRVEPASPQEFSRALEEVLAEVLASGKVRKYLKDGHVYFKGMKIVRCPWRFREGPKAY